MELILDGFNNNRIFVESNQCLVFYAYAIASLYKKAKFVHVIRHPGNFIRSAVEKGWHLNDSIWESGRVKMADPHEWEILTQLQKLAWSWQTTNSYIRDFICHLNQEQVLSVRFEDLVTNPEVLIRLRAFTGSRMSR